MPELRTILLTGALVLGGCATPSHEAAPVSERAVPTMEVAASDPAAQQLAELVASAQRALHLDADAQRQALAAATTNYNRIKGVPERLRLALLLSLPGSAVQDDARALALLEPLVTGTPPRADALHRYAALLHVDLNERARLQRRADQLKEQLEALRAVERSIIDRGLAPQPRKP